MIDRTHAGFRCNTRHLLRTVKGDLPRGSQGTVAYEMDNLGRHLILANWDTGISALITVRATWAPSGLPLGSPWWTERRWR